MSKTISVSLQMELDPWEDLDVDDSDLPSLLRPCKRRRSPSPITIDATATSISTSQPPPEDLRQQHSLPSTSETTSCSRAIPGPAGAVQAAMIRKTLDRKNKKLASTLDNREDFNDNNNNNNAVIPTQEYIRRAVEDVTEFGDDFTGHPWLSALQFLGTKDGMIPSTPISSIKKRLDAGRVNQVVAVIKSCSSNGLGGLIVKLKDPTGMVDAIIHPKVLCEREFRKNLTVGAVLILQKVAIFAPARTAHYLNITLRNLLKVFFRDSGPPSNHDNSTYPVRYNDLEYSDNAKALEMSTVQNMTMDIGATERRQYKGRGKDLHNHSVIQKQTLFGGNFQSNNRASSNASADARRWHSNAGNIISEKVDDEQDCLSESDQCGKVNNFEGSLLNNRYNNDKCATGEEIEVTNPVNMPSRPLIEKSALPEWTDEQLDELFAGDECDGF